MMEIVRWDFGAQSSWGILVLCYSANACSVSQSLSRRPGRSNPPLGKEAMVSYLHIHVRSQSSERNSPGRVLSLYLYLCALLVACAPGGAAQDKLGALDLIAL